MIVGLCRQFHCLPSQLMQEDASLLQLLMIHQRGNPNLSGGEYGDGE
jgi:hypothetical protein